MAGSAGPSCWARAAASGPRSPGRGRAPASGSSASTSTCAARSRPQRPCAPRSRRRACPSRFHNVNAADDEKRAAVVAAIGALFDERRAAGEDPFVGAFLHSLAFGTTLPYVRNGADGKELSRRQMEMTLDVMAHSLVYWLARPLPRGPAGPRDAGVRHDERRRHPRRAHLRRGQRREGRPGGARPPARARARARGHHRQRHPCRRHRHAGAAADPGLGAARESVYEAQPERSYDAARGRRRRARRAGDARARTG